MTRSRRKALKKRKNLQTLCLGLGVLLALLLAAVAVLTLTDGPAAGEATEPELREPQRQTAVPTQTTSRQEDLQAPVMTGVGPLVIYIGETPSYCGSVQVTDDLDPAPTISVDDSQVDLYTEGTYPLIYTAADAAGNAVTEQTTVEVREKQTEASGETGDVREMADALLKRMITDTMTGEEQVRTVYQWIKNNCSYANVTAEGDYLQCAYVLLTEGKGGSYHYFALSKLMLERLGLQTVDVVRQKKADTEPDHYWNLVSLDGGQTWYHFDTMPRLGRGDDFCLVTDKFLDAYSRTHKGSHDRDKTAYPATP